MNIRARDHHETTEAAARNGDQLRNMFDETLSIEDMRGRYVDSGYGADISVAFEQDVHGHDTLMVNLFGTATFCARYRDGKFVSFLGDADTDG